jgi:hypothetical protein
MVRFYRANDGRSLRQLAPIQNTASRCGRGDLADYQKCYHAMAAHAPITDMAVGATHAEVGQNQTHALQQKGPIRPSAGGHFQAECLCGPGIAT